MSDTGKLTSAVHRSKMSPEDVLVMRHDLMTMLANDTEKVTQLAVTRTTPYEGVSRYIRQLPLVLPAADAVLWNTDIWNMASNGFGVFADTVVTEEEIPSNHQFWCWESGPVNYGDVRQCMEDYDLDRPCALQNIVIAREAMIGELKLLGMGLLMVFVPIAESTDRRGVEMLPRLRFHEDVFVGDTFGKASLQYFKAHLEFLQTKISALEDQPITRSSRRRLERAHIPVSPINKVVLRRKTDSHSVSRSGGVDWSCQWLVRGHWRDQWYASSESHKKLFVDPHIKGPPDKPLRATRETIYLAKR